MNSAKKKSSFTYDGSSEEGKIYMAARNACSNFAHANRAVITHNVSQTIKKVLGRDPEMELLYDMATHSGLSGEPLRQGHLGAPQRHQSRLRALTDAASSPVQRNRRADLHTVFDEY